MAVVFFLSCHTSIMGRYYYGDINGKFWFGIQGSGDARHFDAGEIVNHHFHVCGCVVENPHEEAFCEDCYESLEEHLDEMKEEGEEESKTWYEGEGANYECLDIDAVQAKIDELEAQVGCHIGSFTITEDFDYDLTETEYETISHLSDDEKALIARLCLGKQILACMKVNGTCSFYAEW